MLRVPLVPSAPPTRTRPGFLFAALLALSAVVVIPPLGAQTSAKCYDCKQLGWIACPNKECKPEKCGTKIPHKCDNVYSQQCCRGLNKILCPKCKDPVVAAELQAELDVRAAWLDEMKKMEERAQLKCSHVETVHWLLHFTIPKWKVGDTTLTRIKAAHLFAERLEETSERCKQLYGNYPPSRLTANLVDNTNEMMKVTLATQGVAIRVPFKTYSNAGLFSTLPHEDMITDERFHPHVVHTAAHIITHATYAAPLEFAPWFHEAVSHMLEIERWGVAGTFCTHEVMNEKDPWRLANWKTRIYGEVSAQKDVALAFIMTQDADRLTAMHKAYSWSFIEFLLKTRPSEFQKFFEALKDNNSDTKKAMQLAYGWSTAAFQEKWRDYVRKTYAP